MKKIATITLNPAFDIHCFMEKIELGKENYVGQKICNAAGKGVNISRVLGGLGVENTAYLILGQENGAQFEKMLESYGVAYVPLYTEGRVRENMTLHPAHQAETRISFDDFSISKECLDKLFLHLEKVLDGESFLCFSGRIPKGISKEEVIAFLKRLQSSGAKLLVDCNSLSANELGQIKPWLIKPNADEAALLIGRSLESADEAALAARSLVREDAAEQVMISLGGRGLAWSDGRKMAVLSTPKIEHPRSTVGAGDSTVAGYLAGCFFGKDVECALRLAAACGTAACLSEGTDPPSKEDVERLYKEIFFTENVG